MDAHGSKTENLDVSGERPRISASESVSWTVVVVE